MNQKHESRGNQIDSTQATKVNLRQSLRLDKETLRDLTPLRAQLPQECTFYSCGHTNV